MYYYILLYTTIYYYILLYTTIYYYILLYTTIYYYILLYTTIYYYILLYTTIYYYILLYTTIYYYILLYTTIYYYILLYTTIYYYILLYTTIYYYILLYTTIYYYILLYTTIYYYYILLYTTIYYYILLYTTTTTTTTTTIMRIFEPQMGIRNKGFFILFLSFCPWPGYLFFILPWFFLNFGYLCFILFFIFFLSSPDFSSILDILFYPVSNYNNNYYNYYNNNYYYNYIDIISRHFSCLNLISIQVETCGNKKKHVSLFHHVSPRHCCIALSCIPVVQVVLAKLAHLADLAFEKNPIVQYSWRKFESVFVILRDQKWRTWFVECLWSLGSLGDFTYGKTHALVDWPRYDSRSWSQQWLRFSNIFWWPGPGWSNVWQMPNRAPKRYLDTKCIEVHRSASKCYAAEAVLELLLLDGGPCELFSSTTTAIFDAHLGSFRVGLSAKASNCKETLTQLINIHQQHTKKSCTRMCDRVRLILNTAHVKNVESKIYHTTTQVTVLYVMIYLEREVWDSNLASTDCSPKLRLYYSIYIYILAES